MNIVWLDETRSQEVASVGGKVANLARLASQHRVPPGFCLTTDAFKQWATQGEGAADQFPAALQGQLFEAYSELGRRCQEPDTSVAVRSSAIGEDFRVHASAAWCRIRTTTKSHQRGTPAER